MNRLFLFPFFLSERMFTRFSVGSFEAFLGGTTAFAFFFLSFSFPFFLRFLNDDTPAVNFEVVHTFFYPAGFLFFYFEE